MTDKRLLTAEEIEQSVLSNAKDHLRRCMADGEIEYHAEKILAKYEAQLAKVDKPECPKCGGTGKKDKPDSSELREKIEELANILEEPRAIRLLAEWLAIDHDETRLQYEKYMDGAQGLYEYITVILKYHNKADRPAGEELEGEIIKRMSLVTAIGTSSASLEYVAKGIIALFDEKEIRKKERERIQSIYEDEWVSVEDVYCPEWVVNARQALGGK